MIFYEVIRLGNNNNTNYTAVKDTANQLLSTSRFHMTKEFIQHGNITVYSHCYSVAVMSIKISNVLGIKVDKAALVRGALLHDYFLYDWHDRHNGHPLHGFSHPQTAYENAARDFDLSDLEKDIITHHMFPLTPHPPVSKEAWLVCMADKLCACAETIQRF